MNSDPSKESSVSASLIAMTEEMRKNGVDELDIMKTLSEHMDRIWKTFDNYLSFDASLPKEMLNDIKDALPEVREALLFFQLNIGRELNESKEQLQARSDYVNSLSDGQLIGHLVIEGSNSLLERWYDLKLSGGL